MISIRIWVKWESRVRNQLLQLSCSSIVCFLWLLLTPTLVSRQKYRTTLYCLKCFNLVAYFMRAGNTFLMSSSFFVTWAHMIWLTIRVRIGPFYLSSQVGHSVVSHKVELNRSTWLRTRIVAHILIYDSDSKVLFQVFEFGDNYTLQSFQNSCD